MLHSFLHSRRARKCFVFHSREELNCFVFHSLLLNIKQGTISPPSLELSQAAASPVAPHNPTRGRAAPRGAQHDEATPTLPAAGHQASPLPAAPPFWACCPPPPLRGEAPPAPPAPQWGSPAAARPPPRPSPPLPSRGGRAGPSPLARWGLAARPRGEGAGWLARLPLGGAGGGWAEVAGRSMAAAVVRGGAAGWRRWHGRVMGKDRPGSRRERGAGSGLAAEPGT